MSKKYLFIALTNPVAGKDREFNDWYSGRHVPEILDVPGVMSGQRYRAVVNFAPGEPRWRYAAVYEVELEDPEDLKKEITRRVDDGTISLSEAGEQDALVVIYEPVAAPAP